MKMLRLLDGYYKVQPSKTNPFKQAYNYKIYIKHGSSFKPVTGTYTFVGRDKFKRNIFKKVYTRRASK